MSARFSQLCAGRKAIALLSAVTFAATCSIAQAESGWRIKLAKRSEECTVADFRLVPMENSEIAKQYLERPELFVRRQYAVYSILRLSDVKHAETDVTEVRQTGLAYEDSGPQYRVVRSNGKSSASSMDLSGWEDCTSEGRCVRSARLTIRCLNDEDARDRVVRMGWASGSEAMVESMQKVPMDEWAALKVELDRKRVEWNSEASAREVARVEAQRQEAVIEEKRRREQESAREANQKALIEFVKRAPKGTTIFCESTRLLEPAVAISTLPYRCEGAPEGDELLRSYVNAGWQVARETRSPREMTACRPNSMCRNETHYQVSLELRKL